MQNFVITADSGCDLSFEYCSKRDIIPIKMKYIVDGVEYTDNMDHSKNKEFYDIMRDEKMPSTVQLNEADYTDFWTPFLDDGKDIIHICMSSGISGTYNNGKRVAEELEEKYPDRKIRIIDTLMTSTGNGLVAIECANLRDSGASFEEIADWAENNRKCVHACFTTDDITYLHRGGRVSKTGMVLSKALHIFPVMHVNSDGELKVFAKARGKAASLKTVEKYIFDNVIDPKSQTLYISDADNETEARELGDMLINKFGFKDVFYSKIGSIIGSHTGPGLLTLFFLGKERN